MGLLSNMRMNAASPRQLSIFKQKEMVSDMSLDENLAVPKTLLPSYVVNNIPEDTLSVATPMMVLQQAQASKSYYEWEFNPASDMVWHVAFKDAPATFVVVGRLLLIGTNLLIEGCDVGVFKVSLVDECENINNSNIELQGQTISINDGALSLLCSNEDSAKVLEKLCLLSIFEHNSIYKSLTGAVISSYGLQMSDMHVILHSSFSFKDWCEIYLEDEGWVKVWCHIDKVSKKSASHDSRSGNCQIKFYRNDKSKSSKNLLCFIPDCAYVQDIFFYKDCQKRPQQSGKLPSIVEFLNSTNMLKIVGNVSFPLQGFTSKSRSGSTSSMSFFSKNEERARRDSSGSLNSCASPDLSPVRHSARSPTLRMFSPSKRHQRTSSQASSDSLYSTYKDLDNCTISSKGLMIRPISHNGVNHLESMIRFSIPMMDCMRKYGRPNRFNTDRTDLGSLMFGLPKLPCIDYFAAEELETLLLNSINVPVTNSNDASAVAMQWLSDFLRKKMLENHSRSEDLTYKTLADVCLKSDECSSFNETRDGSVTTNSSPIV